MQQLWPEKDMVTLGMWTRVTLSFKSLTQAENDIGKEQWRRGANYCTLSH